MHAAGVKQLRGSESVLARDFADSCLDQNSWLRRLGVSRRKTRRTTLAQTLSRLEYRGRPEYFAMYACVCGGIRTSKQWLQEHEEELQDAKAEFLRKHGFHDQPAHVVATVRRAIA